MHTFMSQCKICKSEDEVDLDSCKETSHKEDDESISYSHICEHCGLKSLRELPSNIIDILSH